MATIESERTIVRAVAEIVSESEQRVRAEMKAETQRLAERASVSERRMVDTLNERFDAVMAALDRLVDLLVGELFAQQHLVVRLAGGDQRGVDVCQT
jgi:putative heme iron utilization protein